MDKFWSTYEIRVILHHCASGAPFPENHTNHYRDTIHKLCNWGILSKVDKTGGYPPTDKAHALVDMWCNTPMPRQKWVDPRFEHEEAVKNG